MVSGRTGLRRNPEKKVDDASVTITDEDHQDKVIVEGDTLQIIYVAALASQLVHHMHQTLHFTQFIEVLVLNRDECLVDETITLALI